LECGVAASATHIVTGDRRHLLPLHSFRGIQIVSAIELVAIAAKS
jgi:predicted nucleic acid-binding protein